MFFKVKAFIVRVSNWQRVNTLGEIVWADSQSNALERTLAKIYPDYSIIETWEMVNDSADEPAEKFIRFFQSTEMLAVDEFSIHPVGMDVVMRLWGQPELFEEVGLYPTGGEK